MTGAAQVCVLIPAHDAAATIGRAVRSALAQPEVSEVVVVDDASGDDTYAVAQAAADGSERLKLIRFETNRGPSAARNAAIAATRAPLIALLDGDDFFVPGRFAALLQGDDWDLIADNIAFVREDVPLPDLTALPSGSGRRRPLALAEFVARNISRPGHARAEFGFLKPLMRRSMLASLDLRYDEELRLGEDFLLYATALANGAKFLLADRYGYVAVERAASLSGRHRTHDLSTLAGAVRNLGATASLDGKARRLLARHVAGVDAKVRHRRFLEVKAEAGLAAAVGSLAAAPLHLAQVARAVLADKIGRPAKEAAPAPYRFLLQCDDFNCSARTTD